MRDARGAAVRARALHLIAAVALLISPAAVAAQRPAGFDAWIDDAAAGLEAVASRTDAELSATGLQTILRLYLDDFEPLENWYGHGAPYGREPLAAAISRGESRFHELLQARDGAAIRAGAEALRADLIELRRLAGEAGVPLVPDAPALTAAAQTASPATGDFRSPEMRSIRESFAKARDAHAAGDVTGALRLVEQAYLQEFEPIEARLPGPVTREIESLIHLRLRPQLASTMDAGAIGLTFDALESGLAKADAALSGESSFTFGAVNAFAIIVREGLEAVLLIAAILAYLTGVGAEQRDRRRIWAGVALGIAGTFATWGLARTLVPVTGAGREMMEGITAIVAVIVLLYVSNWLFQKTYIHDWKNYLRSRVGRAVTTGSGIAMASLAFAAVYREGFETVLFYQALLFDSSTTAVLAGFVPGMVLIIAIGAGIIRLGVKLPLKKLFAATNAILLFLAFAFVGKGVYNLQEAGLFAPHPIAWLPDLEVFRQLFGIYPLVETLFAQLVLVTLLLCTYVYYRRRMSAVSTTPVVSQKAAVPAGAAT